MSPMPSLAVSSTSAWLISIACWRLSSTHGPSIKASGLSLPIVILPIWTWRGAVMGPLYSSRLDQARLLHRSLYEGGEERVRLEGLALQLGMELNADEPGMVGEFDDLGQRAVGRHAGKPHSGLFQPGFVVDVDLVAVAVALADLGLAVDLGDAAAGQKLRRISAEAHGATQIAVDLALFQRVALHPFGHEADHRLGAGTELGRARAVQAREMARRLDHRHLHAEADAEIRYFPVPREPCRLDLALGAAFAEAARNQNAVDAFEMHDRVFLLEDFRIEPVELDPDIVGYPAMGQRLGQRFIAVGQMGVFAHHGDGDRAFGLTDARHDLAPARQIGVARVEAEMPAHLAVEAVGVIGHRHLVDGVDVERGDDALFPQVAKLGDLFARAFGNFAVAATQENIRLDAQGQQLLGRMRGRFGFQFAGRGDERHQRQMHVHGAVAAELVAELADGLEERQAFDVAHRAADLAQHEILAVQIALDRLLDRVGHVRDDLHGGAEIFAAPLAPDDGGIDPARGQAVAAARGHTGIALVMAQIEVGFGAVIGDIDLAMLIGAHGAGIDVDIGIEFPQADAESARLKQRTERRRRKTLAE